MKPSTHYFCAHHLEQMKACESEAIRQWTQLMQRGVKAYVECREEAAQIYLGAAMEVGLLRSRLPSNGIFSEMHVLKPAEFMIQTHLTMECFEAAEQLIEQISTANAQHRRFFTSVCDDFLEAQLQAAQLAEKAFFTSAPFSNPQAVELLQPRAYPAATTH